MHPRPLAMVAAFSLACSIALAGLWGRSYVRQDWIYHGRNITLVGIGSNAGTVGLVHVSGTRARDGLRWQTTRTVYGVSVVTSAARFPGGWGGTFLGLGAGGWNAPGSTALVIQFPHWLPTAAFLIPPAVWWRCRRPRQSHRGFAVTATAPTTETAD